MKAWRMSAAPTWTDVAEWCEEIERSYGGFVTVRLMMVKTSRGDRKFSVRLQRETQLGAVQGKRYEWVEVPMELHTRQDYRSLLLQALMTLEKQLEEEKERVTRQMHF